MNDDISNALGLDPIEKPALTGEIVEKPKAKSKETLSDVEREENDFTYARENFYNVIEKGTEALENMLDVARASEHPRAYEVVSTLMKTLVDANKDLVKMGEERKKSKKADDNPEEGKAVTNNNLFVGSTSELQQMLKELRGNNGE